MFSPFPRLNKAEYETLRSSCLKEAWRKARERLLLRSAAAGEPAASPISFVFQLAVNEIPQLAF